VKIVARAIDESLKWGRRHLDQHPEVRIFGRNQAQRHPRTRHRAAGPFRGSFCATCFVLGPSDIHIVGEELSRLI
jgi:hypothetical protein